MSLYSKNLEFLSYSETFFRDHRDLKYHFTCHCECEGITVAERKYHEFTSVHEVRTWMRSHPHHETWVSLQIEGLRPQWSAENQSDFEELREGLTEKEKRRQLAREKLDMIRRLQALAEATPRQQEADPAVRKLRELEELYLKELLGDRVDVQDVADR